MIGFIAGNIKAVDGQQVIVVANGVGYAVVVTAEDAMSLREGQTTELFIYEHIQERAHDLYGFKVRASQKLFERLLDVNGVGPKAALAIVDLGPLASIKQAIASGNTKYISGASGVGKKTAERVVVDLKDALGEEALVEQATSGSQAANDEALQALVSLGYSQQQALEALSNVDAEDTETRVRAALKELG